MRPRGQTPRMHDFRVPLLESALLGFNEAAGADPADAQEVSWVFFVQESLQ